MVEGEVVGASVVVGMLESEVESVVGSVLVATSQPSSMVSSQLLSISSPQISVATGFTAESLSLQSVLSVTYPSGCSQLEVAEVGSP